MSEAKWGIVIDKMKFPHMWSIAAGISHLGDETYFIINLIFFSVSIGRVEKDE